MISARPNMPTASDTKSRPPYSSRIPKVNLGTPVNWSCPIVPSSSPSTTIARAFRVDPLARAIEAIRPSTTSAKYSADPNCNAALARGGANRASTTVATVPAKNDPSAAVASAGPARPWRAIWCPSSVVTADDVSPGRLSRIAVVEPPYWAP